MNALKKTLAILALLILISQTIRHAYILWVEPRGSVLDQYDQPLHDEISGATNLDDLMKRYDAVHKDVERARKEASEADKDTPRGENIQVEPFKSEYALRQAITDWETKSKEIRGLRFYWCIGLVFFVVGALTYLKLNRWVGLTLTIVAFAEFIYWTAPTFWGSNTREFDRLLLNKFIFSLLSLALLVTATWLMRVFSEPREG